MPIMKTTGKPKKTKIEPPIFDAEGYQTNIKDLNGTPLPDLSKVQAVSLFRRKTILSAWRLWPVKMAFCLLLMKW